MLIGLGIALVYRKIQMSETAVRGLKLPDMIEAVGRAVGAQTVVIKRNMETSWRSWWLCKGVWIILVTRMDKQSKSCPLKYDYSP